MKADLVRVHHNMLDVAREALEFSADKTHLDLDTDRMLCLSLVHLLEIIGEAALSDVDRMYYDFADRFEAEYVSQDEYEDRSIEETLDLGWKLLSSFPTSELKRIRPEFMEKYFSKFKAEGEKDEGKKEAKAAVV